MLKLLNGFVVDSSFELMHDKIMKFKKDLQFYIENNVAGFLASKSSYAFDFHIVKNLSLDNAPLASAIVEYREREQNINNTGKRDPSVDNGFDLILFPYQNKIYGIYYTEHKSFADLWKNVDGVTDYSYNDKDTTEKSAERKQTWQTILSKFDSPEMNGYVVHCAERTQDIPDVELIVTKMPSLDSRVIELSMNMMFLVFKESFDQKNEDAPIETAFMEFNKWIHTDVANNMLVKYKESVQQKLKPTITKADITCNSLKVKINSSGQEE